MCKRSLLTILSVALCLAAFVPTKAALHAEATAEKTTDALTLPVSYEEYLQLSSPTDIAVNAAYTAISDGNFIYIYNREKGLYSTYEHTPYAVNHLQFASDGKLYYADNATGNNFYALDLTDFSTEQIPDIACSNFVIDGSDLYFANAQGSLYQATLTDYTAKKTALEVTAREPALAFWNGELYFTDSGTKQSLYKIVPGTTPDDPIKNFNESIHSLSVHGDVLAYTTKQGDFYAYSLPTVSDDSLMSSAEGNYSAVACFGEYFYAVENNTIKEYSVKDKAFTGYEIASHSKSKHRLNDAVDTLLVNDTLYIADNGNERISIYDTVSGVFAEPLQTLGGVRYLAGDGNTLAAATATTVCIYTPNASQQPVQTLTDLQGRITGITNVFGAYYIVTDEKQFYALTYDGEWTLSEPTTKTIPSPKGLTSDMHSNLYVRTEQAVYKLTEAEFLSEDTEGKKLPFTLPSTPEKIVADYEQTLYALLNNTVYNLTNGATVDFSVPLVYAESVEVTSFTLNATSEQAFVLCDGCYLISTARLEQPTVKTLPVDGADEKVFAQESAEFELVELEKNALLVEFDIQTLSGAEYFPYLSLQRAEQKITALKIGQTQDYALLAVFDKSTSSYSTYAVLKSYATPLQGDDYRITYDESEYKIGYLTNDLSLFKYPYLTNLLTAAQLQRGDKVTVIGEIEKLDYEYYQIRYTAENGESKTGYIPKAYLAPYDGLPPVGEVHEFGNADGNADAEWRFAYLALGFGAICILLDYLILKKRPKDD